MYYVFVEDEKIIGKGQAKAISDTIKSISVTFEQFENIDNLKYQDGEIVQKTESEIEEEKVQERQTQFSDNFIITSWGAFRKTPQGYSSAVEAVNTIFNMVNIAQGLNESLAPLLIFYEVPDFTDPKQCTEEWLLANQKTHEPCDLATFMQWYLEFQTIWAQTQYTSQQVPLSL